MKVANFLGNVTARLITASALAGAVLAFGQDKFIWSLVTVLVVQEAFVLLGTILKGEK